MILVFNFSVQEQEFVALTKISDCETSVILNRLSMEKNITSSVLERIALSAYVVTSL
jgi:hypothetical protein